MAALESRIDPGLKFQSQEDLDIKYGEYHKSFFSMGSYKKITRRHRIKCAKRGFYSLNSAVITCGDVLGMEETCKDIELSANLLVYPEIIRVEEIPFPVHNWLGEIAVRRWIVEDPFMISGVRDYNCGDPLNQINWNATARSGEIMVHKLEHTSSPSLMIYLNVDDSENVLGYVVNRDIIEKGITYAASIAHYALSKGIETGFGSNGYTVEHPKQVVRVAPGVGSEQLKLLLEVMARMVVAQSKAFSTFVEEDIFSGVTNRDYLFITCHVDEDIMSKIARLKSMGNSVEIIRLSPESSRDKDVDSYGKQVV